MLNKIIFSSLLLFTLSPGISWAAINQLKIITEVQTVGPGVVSAKITVQTQDASGASENITDTAHLQLNTSSATGEFSSSDSTWKAVNALTMSKNTANRNFYYKDPTAGNYTLTITATDGQTWTPATQTITIGEGGNDNSNIGTSTASTTETVTTQTAGGSNGGVSTHASQSDLSSVEIKSPSVSAGRPRYVTAGTPLAFTALVKDAGNSAGNYVWSFGDGSLANGQKVSHSYLFPGSYNVVLNANFNGQPAVARTVVQVFTPEIKIKQIDSTLGYIELKNDSAMETNLFGWNLNCGNNSFIFPLDTIISANGNLKIPLTLTKCDINNGAWSLSSESGKVLAQYQMPTSGENIIAREQAIASIKQKIDFISSELAKMNSQPKFIAQDESSLGQTEIRNSPNNELVATTVPNQAINPSSQTAGVIVLDKEPKATNQSFFARLKSWFSR